MLRMFRAGVALSALTGLVLLLVDNGGSPVALVYFTVLSNVLGLVVYTWAAVAGPTGETGPAALATGPEPPPWARGLAVLCLTVTMLVYHLILNNPAADFQMTGGRDGWTRLYTVADFFLHTLTPLLVIVDWVTNGTRRPSWSLAWKWLAAPLAYVAFAVIRGQITGAYTYPFLDVSKLGWGRAVLWAVVLGACFYLVGLLVVAVGRWRAARTERLASA